MKMIIVDDEIGVADAIKRIYNWSKLGIDEVLIFESPKAALEKLKEHDSYILMTDIMMPEMDGLELTRFAVEKYPDIQIIIFSGYDDFKYAQAAMRAGAKEYLLKPVSTEEIVGAVRRAVESTSAKADMNEYDRKNEKTMFSNLLISESMHLPDIKFRDYTELIKFNGTVKWGLCFCVKIIECKNRSGWNIEKDLPILYVAVDNVLNEILEGRGSSFNNNTGTVIAFLFGAEECDCMEKIKECKSVLEQTLEISVAVGVGTQAEFNGTLFESYKEATTACEHFAYYLKPETLRYDDLHFQYDYPRETEEKLLSELEKGGDNLNENLREIIAAYFAEVKKKANIPTYYFEKICDEMIFACLKKLEMFGIAVGSELKQNIKKRHYDIDDAELGFSDSFGMIAAALNSEKNDRYRMMTETVKEHISRNLAGDLSLKAVSMQFHFSSRYFAHVFKQYTGSNYTAYVTGARMEEARRLLRMSDLNINEIARRVGYGDVGHFSRNFKSIVGKRPSEYRREKTYRD